jgi:non-ribosomal peptide synthetase component F
MTTAQIYWHKALLGYEIEKPMNLPVDRKFPSNAIQTGQGFSVEINFNSHIVEQLVDSASRFNVTLYQLCLTVFYIFLFKLTGGQRDLIVGTVHANRYRPELQRIIGMFVNTLPMRVRVDSQVTFEQLLRKVSTMMFEAQPHSNLSYQSIIEPLSMRNHGHQNLIQNMFSLDEHHSRLIRLDHETVIESYSMSHLTDNSVKREMTTSAVAMFDLTLSLEHTVETHSLRGELIGSSDLFDSATVVNMARRFRLLVEQLFSPLAVDMTKREQSISDLSLIFPEEMVEDVQDITFDSTGKTLILDLG